MFEKVKISPSILSADLLNLSRDIEKIERGGASFVHVDVMDGHFVENLSFGIPLIKQLKSRTNLPLDVHLMIDNPSHQLQWYLDAGADIVTVHTEACTLDELATLARKVKQGGAKFGISIKPDTQPRVLDSIVAMCDLILVMSVYPGFSGQRFINKSVDAICEVCAICAAHGVRPAIEVDGGIGVGPAQKVCAAGADILVAGNACFGCDDVEGAISAIKVDGEIGRQAGLKKQQALEQFL